MSRCVRPAPFFSPAENRFHVLSGHDSMDEDAVVIAATSTPATLSTATLPTATPEEQGGDGEGEGEGLPVMDEIVDREIVGKFTGQVKWFNDRLGYGFCTVCDGRDKGKDIFVHHTGIKPVNSNYKTLRKGEYVNFNLTNGHNGPQAVEVTGICGGSLMCDVLPVRRTPSPLPHMGPIGIGYQMGYQMGYQQPPPPPHPRL